MPGIVVSECKQEVSTFNPEPSRYEDFRVARGPAVFEYHRTVCEEAGGALSVFDAADRIEPVPTYAASSNTSGGVLAAESFDRLSADFLSSLTEAGAVDAAYFSLLEADNATLVVGTYSVSLFDRSWFDANGQDPRNFDMVVTKSPHCEPHMFADWCAKLINVDAPGATSANLRSLGHTACVRPIFPLDKVAEFHPVGEIVRRAKFGRAPG